MYIYFAWKVPILPFFSRLFSYIIFHISLNFPTFIFFPFFLFPFSKLFPQMKSANSIPPLPTTILRILTRTTAVTPLVMGVSSRQGRLSVSTWSSWPGCRIAWDGAPAPWAISPAGSGSGPTHQKNINEYLTKVNPKFQNQLIRFQKASSMNRSVLVDEF